MSEQVKSTKAWLRARVLYGPSLIWNILLGRVLKLRRWWDRIDDVVILGAQPWGRDLPALLDEGVRGVVNTCEEYAGPTAAYERQGIEQLRLPTIDYVPPTLEQVEQAVAFIQTYADRGESVYVHCKAGRGRGATIAACWLIASQNLTPDDAQRRLLEIRPHVSRRLARRKVVSTYYQQRQAKLADR